MRCPMCGAQGTPLNTEGNLFRCSKGCGMFDSDPEEGGSASGNNPVRSAINREEFEKREQARKLARMAGSSERRRAGK